MRKASPADIGLLVELMAKALIVALFVSTPPCCHAAVRLGSDGVVKFASITEGKEILTTRDDFIQRLSPFDRSARMKTDKPVGENDFLSFVATNIIAWSNSETQAVHSALLAIESRMGALAVAVPKTIYFIKTTGHEEGNAAYTRSTAIVLPASDLRKKPPELQKLLSHELFHIISRQNPKLREKLYKAIGFRHCNEIDFPTQLKSRRITNPDAPKNDHYVGLQVDGKLSLAVPILFSSAETYNVQRGGEFFQYLKFQFLLVKQKGSTSNVEPLFDGPEPKLAGLEQVSGFFEQVGRNTNYIIHPEEILADNFALLVLGETNAPSPEVIQKMKQMLAGKAE